MAGSENEAGGWGEAVSQGVQVATRSQKRPGSGFCPRASRENTVRPHPDCKTLRHSVCVALYPDCKTLKHSVCVAL